MDCEAAEIAYNTEKNINNTIIAHFWLINWGIIKPAVFGIRNSSIWPLHLNIIANMFTKKFERLDQLSQK